MSVRYRMFCTCGLILCLSMIPLRADALLYPDSVHFCESENGSGDCTSWSSSYDIQASFESCDDTTYNCIVWMICDLDSLDNIYQLQLAVRADYEAEDFEFYYWDMDNWPVDDWNPDYDEDNYYPSWDLYVFKEIDDMNSPNPPHYWDYDDGDYVVRAAFQNPSTHNWFAMEIWMGNEDDCI